MWSMRSTLFLVLYTAGLEGCGGEDAHGAIQLHLLHLIAHHQPHRKHHIVTMGARNRKQPDTTDE